MINKLILTLFFGLISYNLTAQISEVTLYPNPFSDEVRVDVTSKKFYRADYAIQVYDVTGRKLIEQKGELIFGKNEIAFNTSSLPGNGVYIFFISSEGDTSIVKGVKRMTVGIADAQEDNSPNIYPNPVLNQMTIDNLDLGNNWKITIFNLQGQVVFIHDTHFQKSVSLDLTQLISASYFLIVTDDLEQVIYQEEFQKL